MYFNNLVRLATHHLKRFIPEEKTELVDYISISEDKNTPKHAMNWLQIASGIHVQSSAILQQQVNIIRNILATSLSIDAWYSGVEYKNIDNQKYIEYILLLIHANLGIYISVDIVLSEENYHTIQQELFSFSKALLASIAKKTYTHSYTAEQIKDWLAI